MEVVASLSQGRTAAEQCGLFTHKSVPVIFEPPCIIECDQSSSSTIHCMYVTNHRAPGRTQCSLSMRPGHIIRDHHRWRRAAIVQSVQRLATGWTVWGSKPGGGEIFRTRPDRLRGPPSLLYNGYRVFLGGKAAGAWR